MQSKKSEGTKKSNNDPCAAEETAGGADIAEFDLRDMWDTWDGQFEFVGNAYRDAAADGELLDLPKIRKPQHHHVPRESPTLSCNIRKV